TQGVAGGGGRRGGGGLGPGRGAAARLARGAGAARGRDADRAAEVAARRCEGVTAVRADSQWTRPRAGNVAVALLALGAGWALKAFYSRAGVDDLRWVLTPTVRLVEWA